MSNFWTRSSYVTPLGGSKRVVVVVFVFTIRNVPLFAPWHVCVFVHLILVRLYVIGRSALDRVVSLRGCWVLLQRKRVDGGGQNKSAGIPEDLDEY